MTIRQTSLLAALGLLASLCVQETCAQSSPVFFGNQRSRSPCAGMSSQSRSSFGGSLTSSDQSGDSSDPGIFGQPGGPFGGFATGDSSGDGGQGLSGLPTLTQLLSLHTQSAGQDGTQTASGGAATAPAAPAAPPSVVRNADGSLSVKGASPGTGGDADAFVISGEADAGRVNTKY